MFWGGLQKGHTCTCTTCTFQEDNILIFPCPPLMLLLSGANPGICHLQLLFFTHEGIDLHTIRLGSREEDLGKLAIYVIGGAAPEPSGRSGTPFEQL